MHKLITKHAQKLRFLVVGSGLTVLDFGLLFLFVHFGVRRIPANYLSTGISFLVSFAVNRSFTFKAHEGSKARQIALFIPITMFALWVLQPLVIYFLMKTPVLLSMNQSLALFIAKIFATGLSLVWNYVLYNKVVFRYKTPAKA